MAPQAPAIPAVLLSFPTLYPRQAPSTASAITSAPASSATPSTGGGGGGGLTPDVPPCALGCIRLGDASDCQDDQTQTCICNSGRYIASVDECLKSRCTAADAKKGAEYSYGACLFLGVNVSTVALPQPTTVDVTTPPTVYSQTFINVQAIMSSICAALLVLALILGFFSCRARARADAQTQAGSWSNMATHASRPGFNGGGKSMNGLGTIGTNNGGFDPTATFASASYPLQSRGMGMGMGMERSRGFTNRLTLDEREEWEMKRVSVNRGPVLGDGEGGGEGQGSEGSNKSGSEDDLDLKEGDGEISPATFTTRNGSEVDLDGSTVHLARLDRGFGRAI